MNSILSSFDFVCGRIRIEATSEPFGNVLDIFFHGYDHSFVLTNEKEDLAGFRECLALNSGENHRRLTEQFGPFREIVFIARDIEDTSEPFIGGANFICFPISSENKSERTLSVNLNYLFILPEDRGKKFLRHLLRGAQATARRIFTFGQADAGQDIPTMLFFELNDPLRLSQKDYVLDSQHSGLDQIARLQLWTRVGALIIDFAYAQPPLAKGKSPDTALLYAVIGASEHKLPPALLREHLFRFFGLSVLKGKDPRMDPTAARQLAELERKSRANELIALRDATELSIDDINRVARAGGPISLLHFWHTPRVEGSA